MKIKTQNKGVKSIMLFSMKKIVFLMLLIALACNASASNLYNYVYNSTSWVPMISTGDGQQKLWIEMKNCSYGSVQNNLYVDGKIGIGTNSPGQKLEVAGTGNFTTNLYVAEQQVCREDGTNCPAGAGETGNVTDVTGASPITSTGGATPEIGITMEGDLVTTSPIGGGVNNIFPGTGTKATITIQDGTTSQKGAVQLTNSTSSTSVTTAATPYSVKAGYDLADSKLSAESDTLATVAARGNTTTQNLTIGDKLTFALAEFIDNLVNGWLRITGSLNITGDLNVIGNITGGSPVKIKGGLNVLNESGDTQLYVNHTTGNVGIGTTSPGQKLDVSGNINATGTVDAGGFTESGSDTLSNSISGNAATSTALASDPADCAANQFANTIAASGALSCSAIADADVPNSITIDLATTATTANSGDSATDFFSSGLISTTYTDAKCTSAACNDAVYSEATIQSVCTDCIDDAQIVNDGIDASSLAADSVSDSELDGGFGWTLDADLNIDANTFVISHDDNKVGIGTDSPAEKLSVLGSLSIGNVAAGTSATRALVLGLGTIPSSSPADAVQLYAEDMGENTGDLCTGGTASASSVYSTYVASRAFDDSTSNFWAADGNTGWLKYDFGIGNSELANKYHIYGTSNDINPKDWTFQGSNDDSNWDTLDTRTGQTWSADGWKNYTFISNTNAYRYYKIDVTLNNGDASNVAIYEMEIRSLYGAYLKVRNEAGDITTLSPHDAETGEWIFYSENANTGKVLRVEMERLTKKLDRMLGGGFVIQDGKAELADHAFNIADSSENSLLFVKDKGNVGIGTTSPNAELEVDGGIRLNPDDASKPTCDANHRGELWFTESGAGVKDKLEVCAKDTLDTYAWRTLY